MGDSDPFGDVVVGYPKLAAHIALQPQSAIFRKFSALNAKNLLYMQAELAFLEKELQRCEQEDAENTDPTKQKAKYAVSWYWLNESSDDGDTKQLDLVMRIRKLVKEYSESCFNPTSPHRQD